METQHLFTELTMRGITLRNRIFVSPMCQYSSEEGLANEWHLVHLGSRAVGGAALVMSEATAVAPEGRISYADLGIWDDRHVDSLRPVTAFISGQGSVPAIQLAHAGRKASTSRPWDGEGWGDLPGRIWQPVSSTAIRFSPTSPVPRSLTTAEVRRLPALFAAAADRAEAAGFEAFEIHAAHGYLIHQFLSPLCNDRDDAYGGSFDNRARLLLEVVAAVRTAIGENAPLLVRISATDWIEGGWTPEDSVRLAGLLRDAGVDLVDCSSGGIVPGVTVPVGPGYQTHLSEAIRNGTGIAAGAVGMVTSPEQADQIIRCGQADVILIGRELLRDPYWPRRAARVLGHNVQIPAQYLRAW